MSSPKRVTIKVRSGAPVKEDRDSDKHVHRIDHSVLAPQLEEIESKPHRPAFLHWAAFALSVVSLGLQIGWMAGSESLLPFGWIVLDIALGAVFFFEFFSRSGFRWDPVRYSVTRLFDFIAIVPVLALANHSFFGASALIWIVLVARSTRAIDRLLGDGFVRRNLFALLEGFEEQITDRVELRIMARIEADLKNGHFGHGIGQALEQNRSAILDRIAKEHPFEGVGEGLAHLVGLDSLIRRTEERTYDAIVDILKSPEVDRTIHDGVDSVFARMREEVGTKEWRQHLGIRVGAPAPNRKKT